MRSLRLILMFLCILYLPSRSLAWAAEGHRICGQIAAHYLTPKARQTVESILNGESLAMAGTWADEIKGNPAYHYLQVWHYIDFDKDMSYPQMQAYLNHDNRIDAYTRIDFLIYKLKQNQLTSFDRRLLLLLLIHLVEDVHQPMHTAHADDKGGNDFKLRWFNKPTSLHGVWDYNLINYRHMSYKRYAASIDHPAPQQVQQWQRAPISQWIYESNSLAQNIYKNVLPGQTLNEQYEQQYIGVLDSQLLKAGVRLAGVLNKLFS